MAEELQQRDPDPDAAVGGRAAGPAVHVSGGGPPEGGAALAGLSDPVLAGFTRPRRFVPDAVRECPDGPGVHVVWDGQGGLLYAGASETTRSRLLQHLGGDRQASVLHDKVGRLLEASLGRPASREEIRDQLSRGWFAVAETADPARLKAEVMDRLSPALNEVRPVTARPRPGAEPVHLLMKWSAELKAATLTEHKQVAEEKGAVWWGKLGKASTTAMSAARLERVRGQLRSGVPTHCYLYRRGEVWRTRLLELTTNPDDVDLERLPGYYGKSDCNLFALLTGFEPLPADWPTANLLLVNNPTPEALPGALGNQTSPLLMLERAARAPVGRPADPQPPLPPAPARARLDVQWLAEQTLWPQADLEELLAALAARPQVILAGPPGTGKTWVAKHVARYLTQDDPLAYRVLQLHPAYGYEDFIEGLRPEPGAQGLTFTRVDGAVLRMAGQIDDTSGRQHVLILDEMNRANLPRVFGELMYLLEYRDEPADLLYTADFALPRNLLFIGSMNTADRSIRSLDIALRRRFEVFECPPSASILTRYYQSRTCEVPDLVEGFDRLNARLTEALDRHHTVGHTFFMAEPMTPGRLRSTWRRQLRPLLEEYFFDQPALADGFAVEELWPSLA